MSLIHTQRQNQLLICPMYVSLSVCTELARRDGKGLKCCRAEPYRYGSLARREGKGWNCCSVEPYR